MDKPTEHTVFSNLDKEVARTNMLFLFGWVEYEIKMSEEQEEDKDLLLFDLEKIKQVVLKK